MPNSIIKDKNIITLNIDHNGKERTYILDINKGCITNPRGKEISSKPQGFVSTNYELAREIQEFSKTFTLLGYMFRRVQDNYIKFDVLSDYLPLAEKIDALGKKELGNSLVGYECLHKLSCIKKIGLKPFLNWAKEKDYSFGYRDLEEFFQERKLCSIISKEKVEKLDAFSKSVILDIIAHIDTESFPKHYQKILYYMENDHYIEYAKYRHRIYDISQIFSSMIRFANSLECEIPKNKNLFETYNILEKNYNIWKETKGDEALAKNQNKSYLNFAYGNYVVVIPTTAEEFRKEAFEQNNCVYSTYMSRVIEGNTNVVFIRKADQVDKSFITCEVNLSGCINQYLLAHNRRVENKELLVFKELYQNHILNNINK